MNLTKYNKEYIFKNNCTVSNLYKIYMKWNMKNVLIGIPIKNGKMFIDNLLQQINKLS